MNYFAIFSTLGSLLGTSSIVFTGADFNLPTSRTTGGADVTSASVTLSGITGTIAINALGTSGDSSLESFDDSSGGTGGFLIGIGDRSIGGPSGVGIALEDTELGAGDEISLTFNVAVRLISYEYIAFGTTSPTTGTGQGSVVTVGTTTFENGEFFGKAKDGLQTVDKIVQAGESIIFGAATGNSPVDGKAAAIEGQGLYYRITVDAVPEPSSCFFLVLGALSFTSRRRK